LLLLIKGRDEANEFTEDGSSVAAEGEGEWNEEDTWSDTEDNLDVTDEAQEYLDFLAQQVIGIYCGTDNRVLNTVPNCLMTETMNGMN
jgi:hypothetical protein